jgi:hypothetical protein
VQRWSARPGYGKISAANAVLRETGRRPEVRIEDERDEAAEQRDAAVEPPAETTVPDADDDDDVVDAHVWRAQT